MLKKIILLLLLSPGYICFAQTLPGQSFNTMAKPNNSGEEIILETDRQFYCISERIYFAARYKFNNPIEDVHWSTVIYVELIRWNGEKIAQAKFKLHEDRASGYLTIPGTLLSGNYYLRAYTKWMRNFPAENYFYKLIKVLNPEESKIDNGPAQEADKQIVLSEAVKANSYKEIKCFTDKSIYNQREKVELSLLLNKQEIDYSNFCVSVAKAANIDTNKVFIEHHDKLSPDEKSLIFLPELRGISITGKIINTNTRLPLANATLNLSTTQNREYFTTFNSTDKGLFYFTLPDFYGQYDFYLDAVLDDGESAEIMVDNDYCKRSVQLKYIPFYIDPIEKEIALEMAVNAQLSNIYSEESKIHAGDSIQLPFYGVPKKVYYTREYVQLPNLEEFFYELVKEVRAYRIKKQAYLKLVAYSQYQDLMPLILLDNIPVSDINEFLKIPLNRIEKVEIIDEPYIVNTEKFSGLISVSTTRNDFAGIELNQNSRFFSYNLLSEGHFTMPDYSSLNENRNAYWHNLLYWNPDIELNPSGPKTVSFYTSDSKGEYIVYIRSINAKGKALLYGTCNIVVE